MLFKNIKYGVPNFQIWYNFHQFSFSVLIIIYSQNSRLYYQAQINTINICIWITNGPKRNYPTLYFFIVTQEIQILQLPQIQNLVRHLQNNQENCEITIYRTFLVYASRFTIHYLNHISLNLPKTLPLSLSTMKDKDMPEQSDKNIYSLLSYNGLFQPTQPQASEHESTYRNFMKSSVTIPKQELITKLERQSIIYSQDNFEDSFKIRARAYIYSLQIVQVSIISACFTSQLNILNIDAESPVHSTCESSSGGQGDVFKVYASGKTYAIKCIKYSQNTFQTTFSNAVMECFLLKIASALEVGPCMCSPFGFDLVIYRNCIEFPMEFCSYTQSQYLQSDLKEALQKMHKLKIIHYDIKPENINYSSAYNKFVFIDFGLSKVISQQIGQKSWTCFRGSLTYCSSEMEAAYLQSQYRFVDLYYNDSECLRKSLGSFQQRLEVCQIYQNPLQQEGDMSQKYEFLLLKWRLYQLSRQQTNEKQLILTMSSPLIQKYLAEITQFISYLPSGLGMFVCFHDKLWSTTDRQQRTARKMMKKMLKQEHFINDNENEVFSLRFEQIRLLNLQSLTYNRVESPQFESKILIGIQHSKKGVKRIYYLKVLDVIRVEDNNFPMSLKLKVARQFTTQELRIKDPSESPIKITILFLLQNFFTAQTDKYSCIMLQNLLSSLFFFEIITEQQTIQALSRFMNMQMDLSSKLRLSFKFLMVIKWVQGKYQSIYNYLYLQNALQVKIKQFILSLPQSMNKTQRLYYDIMKSILQEPLKQPSYKRIRNILSKHKFQEILALHIDFLNQLYRFMVIQQMEYHQHEGQVDQYSMQRCLKLAEENAKKCGISLCLFTSLHFHNFSLRKDKLLELYLSDINKIAENYKQLKQYSVYVYYQLHRFNRNLLCEESIIILMEKVTKSKEYHVKLQLFAQLLRIYLAKRKEYEDEDFNMVIKVLNFTQETSRQMIILPKKLPNYQAHRHQLVKIVKNIITIYNYIITFDLIPRESISAQITNFIQGVKILISDSYCMECKYLSLMFLSYLYTSRQLVQQNYQRAWNIMIDFATQYIKSDLQILGTLDGLISFSVQFESFQSYKPSLVAMFAEFVAKWGSCQYFFQREIYGQERLREVYSYLLDNNRHQQLIQLLEFAIVYIHNHSVKLYVNTFFMAIFNLIKQMITIQQRNRFYENHADIIIHFRKKGYNPYFGFYFFILMMSNCSKGHDLSLLCFVAKSINFLSARCRQLIKNYYYMIFLYHNVCPPRKTRYLNKIHQKNQFTNFTPLSAFIEYFRIRNRRQKLQPRASKQLNHSLKKLHEHIFIIEHKKIKSSPSIFLQI